MALLVHSSSSSLGAKGALLLLLPTSPRHFFSQSKSRSLSVRYQDPSSTSNSSEPIESAVTPPSNKTSLASGLGFGSTNATSQFASKKKQKGKKERASIIRRAPLTKPNFASQKPENQSKERSQNESAFLLAWIGFGAIIILEGIVLAASGFLPEEWDNFFVKYLYPSFTPTVFLFVAGTVAYGVLKYLQNEKPKSDA